MKTLLFAATIAAVAALNLSAASAAQYGPQSASSGTGHYEWQYHYAGHHPRYQGGWVWVK
ncbi:MAG TPA: hypothetical protein VN900_14095 [Stellaceae bacterium]|jgi:hypothetical protein|nr:hypothetical protein [Stellaceae bacterium]